MPEFSTKRKPARDSYRRNIKGTAAMLRGDTYAGAYEHLAHDSARVLAYAYRLPLDKVKADLARAHMLAHRAR